MSEQKTQRQSCFVTQLTEMSDGVHCIKSIFFGFQDEYVQLIRTSVILLESSVMRAEFLKAQHWGHLL